MPELTPEELAAKAAEEAAAQKAAQEAAAAEEAKKAEEAKRNEEPKTPEEWKALVEKERKERQEANREAQNLRKRANELEAAEKTRREAEMTELEKAQARAKELEAERDKISKDAQNTRILLAASRLGFTDPNDAIALLDRGALAEDEKNLDDLLKAVLKTKPYLGKPGGQLPQKTVPNPGGSTEQAGQKEQLEKSQSLFPTLKRLIPRQ